jgi:endonuclease G
MNVNFTQSPDRSDVVCTDNEGLSEALLRSVGAGSTVATPAQRSKRREAAERDKALLKRRVGYIESDKSDPNGFERIIGESDLTSINYLQRGLRAAAAVCRIKLPGEGGFSYGTGFLVGPRLLMTNHHVLGSPSQAGQAEAEFGFEHDLDGVLKRPSQFNLQPEELFFTDPALDVTLVAVAPFAEDAAPIERFGRLPLVPMTGKVVDGEFVTIVQHPGGQPKQISIRASQIVRLGASQLPGVNLDHFIHYMTDTEPGSSGAPVLNDQWQVVALHHKAVPDPKSLSKGGKVEWIANEGVRISAIFNLLERKRFEVPAAAAALDRLDSSLGLLPLDGARSQDSGRFEKDGSPFAETRWSRSTPGIGHDENFLTVPVKLAPIYSKLRSKGLVAPLKSGSGHELDYLHYTSVIHAKRKFALLTVVDIDGKALRHPGDRPGSWRRDPRIDDVYQPAGEFYEKAKGDDKVQFSRGHLVRRLDPAWGDTDTLAKMGDMDTFHYTNAAPQFQRYNDVDWGNLEDYLLDRAQTTEKRMTVFTGPIYRDDDPYYGRNREGGPWQIPLTFWKIALLQKTEDTVVAAAFINGQIQYVRALYEAKVFNNLTPYTIDQLRKGSIQTSVAGIEAETGLDFGAIRKLDAQGSLESTRQSRWIARVEDVII